MSFVLILLGMVTILLLLSSISTVYGQELIWSEIDTDGSPPARRSHAMTFDPEAGVVILFGGYGNGSHLNDTWVFDPQTKKWSNVSPQFSPSSRAATTIVYEPESTQLILFGGFAAGHSVVHNDTWAYNSSSSSWKDLKPANTPSARASYGMTYDSKHHAIVLFGGFTEQGYFNDLWVYHPDRNTWEEREIAGDKPSPRGAMGFAYDEANDVFVMFGGFSDSGFFGDTWILDLNNNTWTKREPESHPPPARTRMLYVPAVGKFLFFGGDIIREENVEPVVEPYDRVWSYDLNANRWQELVPGTLAATPAKRSLNGIAYDSNSESMWIFGGTDALIDSENFEGREFSDTWSLTLKDDIGNDELQSDASLLVSSPLTAPIIVGVAAGGVVAALFFWKKRIHRNAVR